MPSSPVDTIQKCIAIATHPNTGEHEAAANALTACRLIAKHKIELSDPRAGAEDLNNLRAHVRSARVSDADFISAIEDLFGKPPSGTARREHSEAGDRFRRAAQAAQPPPIRKRSEVRIEMHKASGAVLVGATHAGRCEDCGSGVDPGDRVWWVQKKSFIGNVDRFVHHSCNPSAFVR